jgi:hypothetical protein
VHRSPHALRCLAAALCAALATGCTTDAINVESGALVEDVSYLWLMTARDGEKAVFSPLDEKVVLSLRFAYNYRASYEWYKVEWIAPGGEPYRVVSTRTEFGSHRDLRAELPIRGKRAAALPGLWRVRVSHLGREGEPDRELISRLFRIEPVTPEMLAEVPIDAPGAGLRPLAGDLPADAVPAGLEQESLTGAASLPGAGSQAAPAQRATRAQASQSPASGPASQPLAATVGATTVPASVVVADRPAPARALAAPVRNRSRWPGCPPLYYPPGEGCVEEAPEE